MIASLFLTATSTRAADWVVPADLAALQSWRVEPSDGVKASISADDGGLRLDVDFTTGAGFVVVSHDVTLDLPENFQFAFDVRAQLPSNNLEFKLVDQPAGGPANGENVWWVNRRAFTFPQAWTTLRSRARHFEFAWGPGGDALRPSKVRRVEFAVASSQGGKGSVHLRNLCWRVLPPARDDFGVITATASSVRDTRHTADGPLRDTPKAWMSAAGAAEATYTLAFDDVRELGGLNVTWADGQHPAEFEVQVTDDGAAFETVRRVRGADGGRDVIWLPDAEARAVRLVMRRPAGTGGFGISTMSVLRAHDGASGNDFYRTMTRESPRGLFPRAFLSEKSYWTVMGLSGDTAEALINEDGAVEPFKRGFSIEPFVHIDGRLQTWADGATQHHLTDEVLPLPVVARDFGGARLDITAWVGGDVGTPASAVLFVRYRLTNQSPATVRATLFLAMRPFQVIPPWQRLNFDGGFSPIHTIQNGPSAVMINGRAIAVLTPLLQPDHFGAASMDQGDITEWMARGTLPGAQTAADAQGTASGALMWPLDIAPGAHSTVYLAIPLHEDGRRGERLMATDVTGDNGVRFAEDSLQRTKNWWSNHLLQRVTLDLPEEGGGRDLLGTLIAQVGYILINRDGPAIQPGSRTYERSWIRDGSMTSSALLQLGLIDEARQFIEWYAPNQFDSGKVPCVVDSRGPDPVPEHDSHGQLIWAIVNYARTAGDDAFLRAQYPHIRRAVQYMKDIRATRMTAEFAGDGTRQEPGKPPVPARAFFGLLPESISHEGYSAKPMHSYWDDLFASRGLHDAAWAAARLGEQTDAADFRALAEAFDNDLSASIAATMKAHGIDYIPGCVELGDYDATSTSVAFYPTQFAPRLPADALRRTFEGYVKHVRERAGTPSDYTPYEWRNVGALIRLGMKKEAWEVTSALMKDRRPPGWRHWAEVVRKGYLDPAFIGDMPHTWCGSDFVNSALSMLLYEDAEGALVVFAGLPEAMARSLKGASFTDLHTPVGLISATAASTTGGFRVAVRGTLREGATLSMLVCSPGDTPPTSATLDGTTVELVGGRVRVTRLPAEVVFQH